MTVSIGSLEDLDAAIAAGRLPDNAATRAQRPGIYLINNRCTGTTAYVQLAPASGTGNYIGVAQGRSTPVYFDGVNVDFANPQDPGTAYDLHGAVALPPWMSACKVTPYLPKDGTIYNISDYPQLGSQLGSTFG